MNSTEHLWDELEHRLWASSPVYVIAAKGGTDANNLKLKVRHMGVVFRTYTSGKVL